MASHTLQLLLEDYQFRDPRNGNSAIDKSHGLNKISSTS